MSRRRKRRPTSAKPRTSRTNPSRTRDHLRSTVDRSRQADLQERVRRGMFSTRGQNSDRLHVQTIGGRNDGEYDNHPYAEPRKTTYRPSSAGRRRNVKKQRRGGKKARPMSARQERPQSPHQIAERRLSPIASFRNANNNEYDDEELVDDFSNTIDGGVLSYDDDDDDDDDQVEEYERPLRQRRRKRRKGPKNATSNSGAHRRTRRRPSTAGRVRKRRAVRATSDAILGGSTRVNGPRHDRNDHRGRPQSSSVSNLNTLHRQSNVSGNDSALARSEDLLSRARQYLLNRAGYLNTNTTRFLEEDHDYDNPGSAHSRSRNTTMRSSPKRRRPQSASQYTSEREMDLRTGAGRMMSAAHGELNSLSASPTKRGSSGSSGSSSVSASVAVRGRRRPVTSGHRRRNEASMEGGEEYHDDRTNTNDPRWNQDWDAFGLSELETEVRTTLLQVVGVVELSRLRVQKNRSGGRGRGGPPPPTKHRTGGGVHIDVHISVDSSTSVVRAHEIASECRSVLFALDSSIEDAVVHVDALPTSSNHGGEQVLDSSGGATGGGVEGLKNSIRNILKNISDIYRISKIKIRRKASTPRSSSNRNAFVTRAEVEILVNPELRIRRVHAVARQARELIESVHGVDEGDGKHMWIIDPIRGTQWYINNPLIPQFLRDPCKRSSWNIGGNSRNSRFMPSNPRINNGSTRILQCPCKNLDLLP